MEYWGSKKISYIYFVNIEKLKRAVSEDKIEWRKHALQRMLERDISRANVKEVIVKGEMIQDYESDKPFPSALFYKMINKTPIHVTVALDEEQNKVHIITAYEPSLDVFENDFKTRKKL